MLVERVLVDKVSVAGATVALAGALVGVAVKLRAVELVAATAEELGDRQGGGVGGLRCLGARGPGDGSGPKLADHRMWRPT